MKLKKCLALLLSLCMVLTLCACNKEDKDLANANPAQQNQQTDPNAAQQDPAGDVNFGLQSAPTPDFDSPSTGDDSGKLYTIVGDYAYELDPATLQPIGEPLDPVTHQPVSNPVYEGNNPSTPNNPQDTQPQEPAQTPTTPTEPDPPAQTEEPAPQTETKLPNTGMFLEDD